jgi:hypothetical protein
MHLDTNNEWILLGDLIPWQKLKHLYSVYFPSKSGNPVHPFREALGTLIIQQRLTLSDRKTAKVIAEDPYLQYFIGFTCFQNKATFQPSIPIEFRKCLNQEVLDKCKDVIIYALQEEGQKEKEVAPKKSCQRDTRRKRQSMYRNTGCHMCSFLYSSTSGLLSSG